MNDPFLILKLDFFFFNVIKFILNLLFFKIIIPIKESEFFKAMKFCFLNARKVIWLIEHEKMEVMHLNLDLFHLKHFISSISVGLLDLLYQKVI